MKTGEMILELFEKLQQALPQYNVFLNDDGEVIRNASTPDKDDAVLINCVDESLEQTGVAVIVCARVTARAPVDDADNSALRRLSVPVEIRTQRLDDGEAPTLVEVLDAVEAAIVLTNSQDIVNWKLGEAGEYENKPGWGFVRATHLYQIGE